MQNFFKKYLTNKTPQNTEKQEIKIFPNRCLRLEQKDVLCHNCVKDCPKEAIDLRKTVKLSHDKCNGCGVCIEVCPSGVFSFPQDKDKEETDISRREFFNKFRNNGTT